MLLSAWKTCDRKKNSNVKKAYSNYVQLQLHLSPIAPTIWQRASDIVAVQIETLYLHPTTQCQVAYKACKLYKTHMSQKWNLNAQSVANTAIMQHSKDRPPSCDWSTIVEFW